MPSTRRRKCDEGSRWSCLQAKAPHFFKIIHSAIVEKRKLGIPKKFVRKYGKNLSNLVFLKVPSGAIWRVELIKLDGEVWLQSGWQEFAEYYSIGYGHFLVFRFEGNSRFHVLIFDMRASEIEYPFNACHGEEANLNEEFKVPKMEESENDVSVEILDDFPVSQKRKEKTPLQHHRPREMTRTNSTCKVENTFNLVPHSRSKGIQTDDGLNFPAKECGGDMPATRRHVQFMIPERKLPVTSEEKVGAFERAKGFKSENPFFMVLMQPSYVQSKYILNIPLPFVKKYFTEEHNSVILCVSDGRTWSVKCCLGPHNSKLSSGWRVFVRDNHLKVGDVCVFELIKEIENSMKVVIFRVAEDATESEFQKVLSKEGSSL